MKAELIKKLTGEIEKGEPMKRYNFKYWEYDKCTVICKHDGEIGYCNALSANGLCKCADTLCELAIGVIAEKDGVAKYIELE